MRYATDNIKQKLRQDIFPEIGDIQLPIPVHTMKLNCILVIDDDEPTNFFSRMIIEESGCTNHIRIMESGKDALEYIAKSRAADADREQYPEPDLILLDINIPEINGL